MNIKFMLRIYFLSTHWSYTLIRVHYFFWKVSSWFFENNMFFLWLVLRFPHCLECSDIFYYVSRYCFLLYICLELIILLESVAWYLPPVFNNYSYLTPRITVVSIQSECKLQKIVTILIVLWYLHAHINTSFPVVLKRILLWKNPN